MPRTAVFADSALAQRSPSARSLFLVAPPVDSLNIVRMIISPSSSHSARIDVVGNNIAVVSEPLFAEGADSVLRCNLSVHQFPHFRIRAHLSVPSWVFGIVDERTPIWRWRLSRGIVSLPQQNRDR